MISLLWRESRTQSCFRFVSHLRLFYKPNCLPRFVLHPGVQPCGWTKYGPGFAHNDVGSFPILPMFPVFVLIGDMKKGLEFS